MSAFDENHFRAFRLHAIVQNIGTEFYRKYLEAKAKEKSFASLKALLEDPVEKPKLLEAFKNSPVYSPYDNKKKLKADYPEAADIIKLGYLQRNCELLKNNSVPKQFEGKSDDVFEAVLRRKHDLRGHPGAACSVLYHVRNNFLPGTHKPEFSLNQKDYNDAVEVAVAALEVLGESMGAIEEVEDRIYKAKRDTIDENQCNDVANHYKNEMASMQSATGK